MDSQLAQENPIKIDVNRDESHRISVELFTAIIVISN